MLRLLPRIYRCIWTDPSQPYASDQEIPHKRLDTMNQTANLPFSDARQREGQSSNLQRWGALAGGSALAVFGITRRSAMGVALAAGGGALAYFAATSGKAQQAQSLSNVLV